MAVMNLSLSYNSSRNQTGVVLLGRDVTTVFVLNSSTSDLLHSSVYTFWLSIKLDFLNGTLEWLRSCPANVTTPSCSGKSDFLFVITCKKSFLYLLTC